MNALTATPQRAIDATLAAWVRQRSGSDLVARAAFAASVAEGQGHACARLLEARIEASGDAAFDTSELERLREHSWVGDGVMFSPFVLDNDARFYTWRNWRHEERVAAGVSARCAARVLPVGTAELSAELDELFADADRAQTQWQRAAVAAVPGARLFVLTGGPGTGKTTTVLRMLLILLRHAAACGLPALPILALAAPTGKAAQRLAQAIAKGKDELRATLAADSPFRDLLDRIAHGDARTLHRLLGFHPYENTFAHGASNHLPVDIVVVDEASMADLAMMRQLFDAMRPGAVLILLGDPDQLASVEAGSVLADMVAGAPRNAFPDSLCALLAPLMTSALQRTATDTVLAGHVVTLTHVWRSGHSLQHAIQALRDNDTAWLDDAIRDGVGDGFRVDDCADGAALRARVEAWIDEREAAIARLMMRTIEPQVALDLLREAQVLCALREGPFGAQGVNALMTRVLAGRYDFDAAKTWYHGRPVIVARNDYARGLFNGDVGVALAGANGLRVWFEASDRDGVARLRSFSPRALPAHESAWAITIHRSQGSEYADVAVVLPPDADNPLLTRELIYTAVSRAKRHAAIWARGDVLCGALARTVQRNGGLRDRLRAG
ncbi:MAG: exodeoxyribonuclease V subunit alpha [Dokdonella sp.]